MAKRRKPSEWAEVALKMVQDQIRLATDLLDWAYDALRRGAVRSAFTFWLQIYDAIGSGHTLLTLLSYMRALPEQEIETFRETLRRLYEDAEELRHAIRLPA